MTGFGNLLAVLAMLAGLLRDLAQLAASGLSPSGLTALTALAAAVLAGAMLAAALALLTSVAGISRATAALPLIRRARALREKSWRAGFLRQRDPDAAGRPRPRAPSAAPAAAVSCLSADNAAASSIHPSQLEGRFLMTSIFGVPVDALYHLVAPFTGFLTPALGGLAAVAAIVLLTAAVRLLVMPLSLRALRGQAVAARLAPQLQALRQRYAKQPERLQREMTALYKREGTSMFASLTPFLLQWPLLSVVYLLFRSAQVGGRPNTLLTSRLFGVPLGSHWLSGAGPLSVHGLVFLAVFALLAVLCWLSVRLSRLMTPAQPPAPEKGKAAKAKAGTSEINGPNEPGALLRVIPYITVVIAAFVPLAAGIYLVVSTGWALAERAFFWRTGRISAGGPTRLSPVGTD